MLGEKCCYALAVDAVDVSQQRDPFRLRECLRAAQWLVWMLLEHPQAALAPDVRLTDAFKDLDPSIAQDDRSLAVHPRMRVSHADHDTGDAALGNGSRACRCAAVERARLEAGIESRSNDTRPPE